MIGSAIYIFTSKKENEEEEEEETIIQQQQNATTIKTKAKHNKKLKK